MNVLEMTVSIPTATRIKPPEFGITYKPHAVVTRLKDNRDDFFYQTKNAKFWERASPTVSLTATSFLFDTNLNFTTTLGSNLTDELLIVEDFVVKPRYVKEFKIKVGTLRFDRTLPKISLD